MKVEIIQHLCKACGICSDICPRHIPETSGNGYKKKTIISSERINLCMECGHCVAVCPNQAIEVKSLANEKFQDVEKMDINDSQLLTLIKQRRSTRRYKEKKVPREIIQKIIEAVSGAPTGTARRATGVIVIDDLEILKTLSDMAYKKYEQLGRMLKNPFGRFIFKRKMGLKKFFMLRDFVLPGVEWYSRWYKEGKSDELRRDCPALILFHNPIYEPMGENNCCIAAFHAIMMAEVLNIGTCFNDLIPPMCNRISELRSLIGLPKDREVYASITLGYPKYKFNKVVPRELADVRFI